MTRRCGIFLAMATLAGASGCPPPAPRPDLTHPDPSVKIPSIVLAVQDERLQAAPQLVRDLESDDPAVRFFAIEALYRLTGTRFGYEYFHDEEQRRPAMRRWQEWLDQHFAQSRSETAE